MGAALPAQPRSTPRFPTTLLPSPPPPRQVSQPLPTMSIRRSRCRSRPGTQTGDDRCPRQPREDERDYISRRAPRARGRIAPQVTIAGCLGSGTIARQEPVMLHITIARCDGSCSSGPGRRATQTVGSRRAVARNSVHFLWPRLGSFSGLFVCCGWLGPPSTSKRSF